MVNNTGVTSEAEALSDGRSEVDNDVEDVLLLSRSTSNVFAPLSAILHCFEVFDIFRWLSFTFRKLVGTPPVPNFTFIFTFFPHRNSKRLPVPNGSCESNESIASSASVRCMKQTNPVLRLRDLSSLLRGHIIFTEYRSPNRRNASVSSSSVVVGSKFPTNILVVRCSIPGSTKLPFFCGVK